MIRSAPSWSNLFVFIRDAPRRASPTQPAIRITGAFDNRALAIPERAFVKPGPAVTRATAGFRVIRAQASAISTRSSVPITRLRVSVTRFGGAPPALAIEGLRRLVDYQDGYAPGMRRYDTSTRSNPILIGMLEAACRLLVDWQPARIEDYLRRIARPAVERLRAEGFGVADEDLRAANLFGIALAPGLAPEAVQDLSRIGSLDAPRAGLRDRSFSVYWPESIAAVAATTPRSGV